MVDHKPRQRPGRNQPSRRCVGNRPRLSSRATGDGKHGSLPPGFILCAARSGSTLLRLILNGHPEIACPPETNLGDVFFTIGFAIAAVTDDANSGIERNDDAKHLAASISREVADQVMGSYAKTRGKRMWIDKSLSSVFQTDHLTRAYPEARFICLYRQCSDTIASLREACTWSFDSFGVLPYVKADPAVNLVQALATYWIDRVSRLQLFEDAHPRQTLRVRYEDLVASPEETVARLLEFLGVSSAPAAVASALSLASQPLPVIPGDVKARFSRGIDPSSVGRGWAVPMETIAPEIRERVDALSRALEYEPLPNLKACTAATETHLMPTLEKKPQIRDILRLLERHVEHTRCAHPAAQPSGPPALLKLVLTDCSERWLIDLVSSQVEMRDGAAEWLALTDSATLMSMVSGHSNPGTALRNSTLQVASSTEHAPDEYLNTVDALMTLLRE